jgi:outer membrane protein TolC
MVLFFRHLLSCNLGIHGLPMVLFLSLLASPAIAAQPLSEFLDAARQSNLDNREALLATVQREGEALVTLGKLLPAASVRGIYTRSQYEAVIAFSLPGMPPQNLTIQPLDQVDAYFQLDVPIVDVAGWFRTRAAQASTRAARDNLRASELDVAKQIVRYYYQLTGAEALLRSAQHAQEAAQVNHQLTIERRAGGVATDLDVSRSAAQLERTRGNIADAELSIELARRALRTLTGLTPNGDSLETTDDLREEAPLVDWEKLAVSGQPAIVAAMEQRKNAQETAQAIKFSLLPTLSMSLQEHLTNATGFLNQYSVYAFTTTLNWRLDVSAVANLRVQAAAVERESVRVERALQSTQDQIHEAWQRVRVGIAKSRAARAEEVAAQQAATLAAVRFREGSSLQLEVIQAQRDAFSSEVTRIQADADLRYARALLRLCAGLPVDGDLGP